MNTLSISSHDELVSFVPHLLRFHPEGMVCVPLGRGGPVSRLDLPPSGEEMEPFLQTLSDVYLRRHPTERIALLAFGDDRNACIDALTALGDRLAKDHRGPDVGPILWVNGDQWLDVLDGTSGTVDPSARARMDAEFALLGQIRPSGTREDLAATMHGDPAPVADHLPAAQDRVMTMDLGGLMAEGEWLGSRLDQFTQDRQLLSDVDAARVLAVIHDSGVRNEAETRMTRASAPLHTEFWHDLVRRAPDEVRDTPAAMLALSSYLDGKGAQAWVALDQIAEARPPLAELVAGALEQAIDPAEWDRAMQAPDSGALLQQAVLRDQATRERHGHDQDGHNHRGLDGPDPSAPSR